MVGDDERAEFHKIMGLWIVWQDWIRRNTQMVSEVAKYLKVLGAFPGGHRDCLNQLVQLIVDALIQIDRQLLRRASGSPLFKFSIFSSELTLGRHWSKDHPMRS